MTLQVDVLHVRLRVQGDLFMLGLDQVQDDVAAIPVQSLAVAEPFVRAQALNHT